MNGAQFSRALLDLAEELHGLTELPRKAAELAAPKLAQVIDDELAAGVGPRGELWPALKDGSGRVPFSSSDRMREQVSVAADGAVVRGKLLAPWNVHQYGSRNPRKGVPPRPIFQRGELSPSWSRAVEEATNEAFEELTPRLRAAGG